MTRRFVTVEDLRRVSGRELLVEEDTIVTPQALEAAQAAGIAIRTRSGAYQEPTPDRGPDAARAASSLPALPEPAASEEDAHPTGVVVTAVGRTVEASSPDQPPRPAQQRGGNISQRMIDPFFHLV
jgi:hypothetical protein